MMRNNTLTKSLWELNFARRNYMASEERRAGEATTTVHLGRTKGHMNTTRVKFLKKV